VNQDLIMDGIRIDWTFVLRELKIYCSDKDVIMANKDLQSS